jgi:hypothetical protein
VHLLIGFVLGFLTSFLIFSHTKSSQPQTVTVQKATVLKKQADSIEVSHQRQIEVLQQKNTGLQQELKATKSALDQLKSDAKEKEKKVKKIINPGKALWSENLFREAFPSNDLALKFPDKVYTRQPEMLFDVAKKESAPCLCDSLEKEVLDYIEANHRKDSVYESQILLFDSMITGKDLLIEASQKAYSDLKLLFDQSISNQSTLQKENFSLRRQNKRQRFKNKILTSGLLILSGFTANYMLRH